ncbi:hypothetical protein GCM10010307_67440 [Streptomyces vastus]|uniref:Transposase n=1 Tax=Streptomyces vastus TaxID=285451 RepID=A0ABN3RKG8_9ACTN
MDRAQSDRSVTGCVTVRFLYVESKARWKQCKEPASAAVLESQMWGRLSLFTLPRTLTDPRSALSPPGRCPAGTRPNPWPHRRNRRGSRLPVPANLRLAYQESQE